MKDIVHVGLIWHGAWCHITHPAEERRECCILMDKQASRRPIAPSEAATPAAPGNGNTAPSVRRAVSRRTRRNTREDEATLEAAINETLASAKPMLAVRD